MTAYGPLRNGDPLIGTRCPACHVPFTAADWVAEIPVGPGGNPDAQLAARMDGRFQVVAVPVHWPCHTGHRAPPTAADTAPEWMRV